MLLSCTDQTATAAGQIDSLGNFTLRAADPAVGIPAGRYKVTFQPPSTASVEQTMGSPQYEEMMRQGGAPQREPSAPADIPAQFLTLQATPIVLELKPGPQEFNFDLAELAKQ